MVDAGRCRTRLRIGAMWWFVIWVMAASCGYQELPRLSGADAAGDGPDFDGPPKPPQYTSCMGLPMTCGAGGNASCCEPAMTVPGGTFRRSDDINYPATVSTFVLDRYEVTVGRCRSFVNAGLGTRGSPPEADAGAHPNLAGSGWDSAWNASLVADITALTATVKCDTNFQTWTNAPGTNENKPIN